MGDLKGVDGITDGDAETGSITSDGPKGGVVNMQITEDKIRIETRLAVPVDQAWALLTHPEHIPSWWADHVKLEARLGGRLTEAWLNAGRRVVTSGEVMLCDAPIPAGDDLGR